MNATNPVRVRDPLFVPVTSSAFHRDQVADLAAGRCAAIRVSEVLSESTCAELVGMLAGVEFDTYGSERVSPPVMRLGVAVSDHRQDGTVAERYWESLAASEAMWRTVGLPVDPFRAGREALQAHWPSPVRVGCRNGRRLGAGVIREPNQGFRVHFDDASREFSGKLLDANLVAQFAFNLYLSVPESGGETVVWRHRWRPADEEFRLPHSYGYAEEVVGDAEWFALTPSVGEALLLDPRNFHAVRPSHGGRRIAAGFAVGLTDTGELVTWA